MWPLFKEGDLLVIRPVEFPDLRVGDCVVFRPRDRPSIQIVHRVSALVPVVRTKGDHRPQEDDESVEPKQIAGLVVACLRAGRRRSVARGWRGRTTARQLQAATLFDPQREAKLGRVARAMRRALHPITRRWLLRTEVATFVGPDGGERQVMMYHGRIVATGDSQTAQWVVDWPQRLWLDPRALARAKMPDSPGGIPYLETTD